VMTKKKVKKKERKEQRKGKKDSNPFTVHTLLLWFSGWYSIYRFIWPNCLWFESLTSITMQVEILPTIRPIWRAASTTA
jgi:hypothetical protein